MPQQALYKQTNGISNPAVWMLEERKLMLRILKSFETTRGKNWDYNFKTEWGQYLKGRLQLVLEKEFEIHSTRNIKIIIKTIIRTWKE